MYKPYIGTTARSVNTGDMKIAVRINRVAEILMVVLVCGVRILSL